jgi:hypothetical protein
MHAYSKVPRVVKTRATTVSATTLMSAGAPAGDTPKITLCPVPSGAFAMLKRTVLPTPIVTENGLKMLPGVKTSTVVGAVEAGDAGDAPPHAEIAAIKEQRVRTMRAGMDSRVECGMTSTFTLA